MVILTRSLYTRRFVGVDLNRRSVDSLVFVVFWFVMDMDVVSLMSVNSLNFRRFDVTIMRRIEHSTQILSPRSRAFVTSIRRCSLNGRPIDVFWISLCVYFEHEGWQRFPTYLNAPVLYPAFRPRRALWKPHDDLAKESG